MKSNSNTKGQTWSLDLVVGSVIFLFVLAMFYTILIVGGDDQELVRQESERLSAAFDSDINPNSPVRQFMRGTNIDEADLLDLYVDGDYDAIREQLGITGHFCITVTLDTDVGNEVLLGLSQGQGNFSFGSGEHIYIDSERTIVCGTN